MIILTPHYKLLKRISSNLVLASLLLFYANAVLAGSTLKNDCSLYADKFWKVFASMQIDQFTNLYEDKVLLLPRSFLRIRELEIDYSNKGRSKFFTRSDVLSAYQNFPKIAPFQQWRFLFKQAYNWNTRSLSRIKFASSKIKPYLRNKNTYFQNRFLNQDDWVLVVNRGLPFSRQRLIFVFDQATCKVKAQTILINTLDKSFFPDHPQAV